MKLIDKSAVVAEIDRRIANNKKDIEHSSYKHLEDYFEGYEDALVLFKEKFLDTLEVIDPYEQWIQYPSREDGIKAHAEDYSWNIESELFSQLTPEQQKLWRKEIEQACISGGYCGLNLQKDSRYDDTHEVKDVDFEKEIGEYLSTYWPKEKELHPFLGHIAKHFFELGLKVQKGK